MADIMFNIAKGRAVELANRVNANDPANSALIIVALKASGLESDATLRDYDDLAAILAAANDEATNSGYARKTLTDASGVTVTTDDSGDLQKVIIPDQTWSSVAAAGGAWGALLLCYDSDTTGGTDSNIIPISKHDFAATPAGGDVNADFSASNGAVQAA